MFSTVLPTRLNPFRTRSHVRNASDTETLLQLACHGLKASEESRTETVRSLHYVVVRTCIDFVPLSRVMSWCYSFALNKFCGLLKKPVSCNHVRGFCTNLTVSSIVRFLLNERSLLYYYFLYEKDCYLSSW